MQPPTSGVHALRAGPVAVFDVALTVAFIAAVWGYLPLEWRNTQGLLLLTVASVAVGEGLHLALKVRTAVTDPLLGSGSG